MSHDSGSRSVTAVSFLWRLERLDGAGVALTSHDEAIAVADVRYQPARGLVPASIVKGDGDRASECDGALDSDAFTSADLVAGRWDGAKVTFSSCDWQDPSQEEVLSDGELGEIAVEGDRFTAELLSPLARLGLPICPTVSPECRAELGDRRCRIDLSGRSERFEIVAATDEEIELDRPVSADFCFGAARWLRGRNSGLKSVTMQVDQSRIRLRDAPPFAVRGGDMILLQEGCDKRMQTCAQRFRNAINFRGEPFLPGNDLLTRYPGG